MKICNWHPRTKSLLLIHTSTTKNVKRAQEERKCGEHEVTSLPFAYIQDF